VLLGKISKVFGSFSREWFKSDLQNLQSITKWHIPKKIRSLRECLAHIGYYHKFIKSYARTACPLTSLLNKNSFVWNEDVTLASSLIKDVMYYTPILETPNFGKTFLFKCDGRETIGFESKQFKVKDLDKSTYEKKMI
jgi:hypothetical protein